jgi:pimeloyl-ACP methyl ester carboxylesterase
MRRRGGALGWVVASCFVAAGCQGVSIVKVGGGPALSSDGRMERIGRWAGPRSGGPGPPPPLRGTSSLVPEGSNPSDPGVLLARAEASHRAGVDARRTSKDVDALYQLDALADSSGALASLVAEPRGRSPDPGLPRARVILDAAQEEFLRVTSGPRVRLDEEWRLGLAEKGIRLTIARDREFLSPESFDEFLFVDDYRVKNLDHEYKTEGVGVPLIALRKFNLRRLEGRQGEEKFLMPRQVYPMTALLKLDPPSPDQPQGLRLELHDPLRERRVELEGRPVPLAADLTTPLVYHFARSPLPILQEVGLLDPQWLEKLAGLYMLHPYEPGKIPVVLVHGLRSSPAAWMKVINDLRGDPNLRDRYQFWLFMYPTGTPFPASAARLRKGLDELREVVDPAHSDRSLDRTVLIGHSMGGLISKMMIESSGDEVWKLVGRRPFEELRATPERKEMLRQIFFFEPHPSIARVVFIATPHRGSELGDQFVGRLADRLIRLPISLRVTYRALLAQNGPEFFTPEIRKGGLPSSIDELRPDNPLLMTLARLPVRPGVPVHSIIGQEIPDVPIERGSDGVVPYSSSHLDWSDSERVVPGDHSCQGTPETILELRRLLYLHLGQVARGDLTPSVNHASRRTRGDEDPKSARLPRTLLRLLEGRGAEDSAGPDR